MTFTPPGLKRGRRLELLRALVDCAQGDTTAGVPIAEVTEEIGLPAAELSALEVYLQDNGLIRGTTLQHISVTRAGVDLIEALEGEEPAMPLSLPDEKHERTTATRLFISHASGDVKLAEKFVALVDACLRVGKTSHIRCTSVPGYKLEPGDDAPEVLRANLRDAQVVVGLLTPTSLESKFVLMELGAAWAFKSRVCPLLANGVDFAAIPGPFEKKVHATRSSNEDDIGELLESISKRCEMPWRVETSQRAALIRGFAAFAQTYPVDPKPTALLIGAVSTPSPAPTVPPNISRPERIARLMRWLKRNEQTERAEMIPTALALIDAEAEVPPGSAAMSLSDALGQNWQMIKRDDDYVTLRFQPRVHDVEGEG